MGRGTRLCCCLQNQAARHTRCGVLALPTIAATIYLHWVATPYTWGRFGLHHTIISGDGRLNRLHAYSVDLPAHTWRRNSNSVALSCARMGGQLQPSVSSPLFEMGLQRGNSPRNSGSVYELRTVQIVGTAGWLTGLIQRLSPLSQSAGSRLARGSSGCRPTPPWRRRCIGCRTHPYDFFDHAGSDSLNGDPDAGIVIH